MHHYNSKQIRKMVESLAMVYNIPVERWFLTYGTAMVVHGLSNGTGDIDISLNKEDWEVLNTYLDVDSDALGQIIELPGKIEIRSMESLMTEHTFIRLDGVMVPTLESLHHSYVWFTEHDVFGRDKRDADLRNINLLAMRINADKHRDSAHIAQVLSTVMADAVSMIIQLESSKMFDMMGDDCYRATIQDDSNAKWGVKVHPKAKAVEFWEINEIDMHGNAVIHSIKFDTRVGRAV